MKHKFTEGQVVINNKGQIGEITWANDCGLSYKVRLTNAFVVLIDEENLSLVPKFEFGHTIGSNGWAYEVAKIEGEVLNANGIKYHINDCGQLCCGKEKYDVLAVSCSNLTGWTRKVETDKEALCKKYLSSKGYSQDSTLEDEFDCIYEFIIEQDYEINKK